MSLEYNTSKRKLQLPEYGRNIHHMVDMIKAVNDKDKRTQMAYGVVQIMGVMNPHLRDENDFRHKLWDHLFIMADFDLDIDAPFPMPEPKVLYERPNPLPYNTHRIKYRYYGHVVEDFIEKAKGLEGNDREEMLEVLANHMKSVYVNWNKDHVEDEFIFNDIEELSDGELKPDRNMKLKYVKPSPKPQKSTFSKNKKKGKGGKKRR